MISSGFQKLTCRGVRNARLLKTLGTVSIRPPSKQNNRCVVGKRSYSQTREFYSISCITFKCLPLA